MPLHETPWGPYHEMAESMIVAFRTLGSTGGNGSGIRRVKAYS